MAVGGGPVVFLQEADVDTRDVELEAAIARRLEVRLGERVDYETILVAIRTAAESFASAPVRNFVPTFIERRSVELLRGSMV
jgi:hypothetical protein